MVLSALRLVTSSVVRSMTLFNGKLSKLSYLRENNVRDIHITSNVMREFRQGSQKVRSSTKGKVTVLEGEGLKSVEISQDNDINLFPDDSTPFQCFDGIEYRYLPIINIKSTQNNTIMTLTDYAGKVIKIYSAGIEGFKNTKKGTNIAAQQAAYKFGKDIYSKGYKTMKVRIQGIGPGRTGSLKGLQLAELSIVSLTDDTRVSWHPPRPRKQRRI